MWVLIPIPRALDKIEKEEDLFIICFIICWSHVGSRGTITRNKN